ncbi:hypothetical protein RSAG8_11917, partial [Rhizoctonia solani AG-8 WAC10335]
GGSSNVGPTATGIAPNNLSLNIRQREAAVTKELTTVKLRLRTAEDDIASLRSTIVELQARDEESKREHDDQALCLEMVEAQAQHLQTMLHIYLKSQGIQMDDLGSASTISELYVGKVDALSADETSKTTDIMNESLAICMRAYTESRDSVPRSMAFTQQCQSPIWSGRPEWNLVLALLYFASSGTSRTTHRSTNLRLVPGSIIQSNTGLNLQATWTYPRIYTSNQRVMSSLCAKRYLATKQQVTRHHGEKKPKIVGIKRRVEELDAPEHKVEPDSEVEQPLGDLASDGLGYQPDNEGHDGTPGINIDPALLEGAALDGVDPQAFDPNLNPSPSIPILNAVHNTSEDVNAEALAAHTKDFNSKNNIRSRKSTKLTTRSKQQKGLTGVDDKFKGSKYDSYETIGVMSEDEHVDSVDKNGETITTFISHAYDFLSQEMIDCRDAIDKVTDPTKGSKKVTRKCGSTRSGPPPKAAKIGALRSWMIKSDVLLANPQWFTDGRVYKSGPEWGEPEGEELISRKSKKPKLDFARPFWQFGVYTKPSI